MTPETTILVRRPDGTTQPFEPERITRRLFAATAAVGRPDAFLARELTEGVVHFLTAEDEPLTTALIAEMTSKVVRELGRPDLARAYEARQAGSPPAHRLSAIYPPDLVSAHREGLIHIEDERLHPKLAVGVVDLPLRRIESSVRQAEDWIGQLLVVDGPEWDLAEEGGKPEAVAEQWVKELDALCRLRMVINLNVPSHPRSPTGGFGPLFAASAGDAARRRAIARAIAGWMGDLVRWHADGSGDVPIVREVVDERRSQPIILTPGLERNAPPILLRVGINLSRLAHLVGTLPISADALLAKAASLARFAKTAAHVKQDWLRQHGNPAVREQFRLDRARWVLIPQRLEEAVAATDRPNADSARQLLKAIRVAVETDRPRAMPVAVVDESPGKIVAGTAS